MILKSIPEVLALFHSESNTKEFYNLTNITLACDFFGNPQESFKSIHITGTNGKGSVTKMTGQILQEAGYNVGVFTSPHLWDVRERWLINNEMISEADLIRFTNKTLEYGKPLGFFERATLIAFFYFKEKKVDFAVLEVGLGGRLDATNIVKPVVTAITSIGLDHIISLGPTIENIAFEKAGIIKPNIPLVINQRNQIIEDTAKKVNAPLIFTEKLVPTNLPGDFQEKNAAIAYEITKYLGIPENIILKGLQNVIHAGRIDYIRDNLFIDGAHNEDGIKKLGTYIGEIQKKYSKIYFCVSLKKNKVIDLITQNIGQKGEFIIVSFESEKLEPLESLKSQFEERNIPYTLLSSKEIIEKSEREKNALFVVFGSLYMIGVFLQYKNTKTESL